MEGVAASARRRAPEITQERLIDAAGSVFAERGYAATTIRQICQRAGVSIGSFYHHFEGKPGLTARLFERGHERVLATLVRMDVRRPATIESVVGELLSGGDAALYRALREATEVEPSLADVSTYYWASIHGRVVAVVKAGRAPADEEYALDAGSVAWTFLALVREAIAGRGAPTARAIATVVSSSAASRARADR